jgi:hypothetical protein
MVDANSARADLNSYVDRSNGLRERLKSECFGTWSRATLDRFCDKGDDRVQQFCSSFN